eukprot:8280020-Alexandrium_andersonii.AAC.1
MGALRRWCVKRRCQRATPCHVHACRARIARSARAVCCAPLVLSAAQAFQVHSIATVACPASHGL